MPLFSGSGAVKIMDLYEDEPNDDYESYAMRQRMQPHGGQLMMTTQVTTKVPPGFDGKTSWFAFEDAIDDWCDITELEAEKWGPALRNRLEGEASVYKRLLDREQLREPNGRGVEYFKRTLRPHFVKGAQTVFLYRFMRFMKNNRGNAELMKWMTRFQIDGRRLEESWMDLCPELDLTSPAIVAEVTARRNAHNNAQAALHAADNNHVIVPWTDDMIQAVHNEAIGLHRQQHRDLFPLSPNLIALIFISTADLSQDQRQSLTSIMTHRNRTMDQYRVGELRETFIEMFCTVKTAVDNPMMNPSGSGGRRAFLVLEEGDLDGSFGYWAEDEEDGAEGFLDALEDVFWIWDDNDYSWFQRRFQGRRTRKGKGKGKGRKGKGKGKGGRRFFRPRNKGKGKGKRKGKSHLVEDDSYYANEEWQGYENENWNEGYWAYEDETAWQSQGWDEWQEYDEYGYFQGKGKKGRKGKGKGKKGHGPSEQGKGQGDGKGEANYVNPSHSSQPSVQQAALPSSASASGFFVTHSGVSLTSVKVTQDEDQSMEPDLSGCAFLGQEANPVQKVEEEGVAFHTENQMPPTVAILDLGCTRAMGSRNAVNAFCDYVDNNDCGLWYKIEPTSSRFFFANSQQTKCTEKLVIHMYDKSWSVHTTEFDIVEEGNVPLLMSLPQMRNLGFQFELSPQKSFLNCTRLGIWKHQLRMAKSTHLVMDFQDIAWYMSAVYFKTPEVTSFFSQNEHFEYSQLSVETFAYATDDDWEIDYHRRELIRHHKTLRSQLFKISGSKCPISFDDLESTRTTFLEMKNGTKKVEKDDWRAVSGPEKRFDKQWKGRTVFKIKAGAALPAEGLSHVKSSSKPARISDPSDEVKPEHSSPEEKAGKSKSSSAPAEEGKSGSSSSGLKRRLGRKTASPSEHDDFGKEFIGELEKELDMELDKSDDVRKRRPKGDDVDYSPSSDDERWEKAKNKPGNESLEPRRISVPLPGSEAQALTPAYRKMIKRLDDKVELYKLHVKHYHMSPTQFRRRTSMLNLPERIYEKYEDVFNKCRVCSMSVAPPPRAKISGIRASVFGDVVFVDHCEIELKKKKYVVLLVLDGATNLLWATAQNSLDKKETLTHLRSWNEQNNCIPKAIVGDEAFFSDEFLEYYKFHGIKDLPCGPRTPWPNRAETAVRLFKKQWTIMAMSLEGDERFNGVTIRQAVKMTAWARNTQLTISGYSPLEIATGRRPPDLFDVETANPEQLTSEPPEEDVSTLALQRLALRAHQEARQAADLRHDMARRTMPSDGPYKQGDEVFYWHQDSSKFKEKGKWIRGKVLSQEGAMVHLHTNKAVIRVNQSKVRRDHDEWHDVSIPNLDETKEEIKDEGDLKREDHNLLCEGCLGEQAFWFYDDQKCDVLELFGSSSGYSWMMARKGVKVGQPIDHKHGSNLNTAYGQAEAWKKIMKMDPEIIYINNPSPQSARKMVFRFCFDVITWQCKRNKKFIVTCPEGSYFSLFLDQKRWHKILSKHLCWERVDLQHFCKCEDEIRDMIVYHSYDDYQDDISWFEFLTKKKFFSHEACWKDPHWKALPARFLAGLIRATPEVSRSYVADKRQEFLLEDILEDFDQGLLCGTCMHHDRYDKHSLLLRDLDVRNDDIPVPLRHILPQKFSTPSLVSTLRMIEALPLGTEVSVRESTNEKIVALIPGLQNIRRMTLPQMYFESCSIFCGTYGRVNPLFSLPEDSVILLWNPGSYHRIFFMFMSQLYPHYKEFQVNKWNIIAFSTETSGAIRRTTVGPPVNNEVVPPHPPVGADGNDPIHPDDHGPPPEDDVNMPPDGANDSGEQDDSDYDMDDPHVNPPPGGQPPFPPQPPPSMPPSTPEVQFPTAQPSPFSNPDETIEAVMQPVPDDSSSEEPHITEPERIEIKQRHVSHDSDEKPPKAKARVMTKKQKVQLPGHQNPIEVPTVKPPNDDEDDVPNPTASSSNDPTIPLPTTTPHSFTPAQPEDEEEYNTPQSSQDTIPYQDVETEEPIITEDEVEHLNSNGTDDTQPYDSEFVQFEGDYFVNLGHNSAAPDFKSYDINGFRQFCQYLAKNGKKTPKAESVITPQVLQKYAKQIKQAKLEEFRSFLDFTAMKFRDRRKHKIENFVTGRWVLTIKTDKDGQFKKFKARWVCRGFQDAQKWDLQTDSPTATRYGFRVASQHAASSYWDLLHIDLKTAFLQGETYDLERRVIHVQLPSDIGLPPYLVGLCTRSVYGLADAPRRWWNRLDKFLISLGIQPTRADRCTYVCYDGAFKNDDVSSGTKTPKQVSYYVDSPSGEMTRDESFDIANEVRQSFAVEERLFSLCHAEGKSLYQQQRYTQKKSEDCAWTPVVDEELLKFLESVEHKAGWIPYQNGHAQVSYRAKALRTPDPYYTSKQYFFRTSIVKRKGVWWLLEMNADIRKEKNFISLEEEAEVLVSIFLPAERAYLASTPQLTPEVVEELLEHFMDPVHGSNSKGRKTIGMCCLHVDDLFVTGTPEFLEKFKNKVKASFKIGHEDVNDLMFTGQRVKWQLDEKTKKKSHIVVEQSLCVSELTEIVIQKGQKDDEKCDKDMHTAYRSLLGSINWLQSRTQFQACYQFSRCASAAASPTVGDCKALNKLCKQIVNDPMELKYWPLEGNPRLMAMPDAAFRNNSDKSSQRAMVIFMSEPRKEKSRNSRGSLIFFESTKIKRTTLSTTVAELYALMKCYGTCQMLRGLIKDITGHSCELHMRTDANNLVTTASTTHVPEQQETIHMIQMLRKEACSGSIADLSHIRTQWCLADCLTKKSANPQALIDAVKQGILKEVDAHPPFRTLVEHKAYLRSWLPTVCHHVNFALDVFYLGESFQ